jgi:hypothetical protein
MISGFLRRAWAAIGTLPRLARPGIDEQPSSAKVFGSVTLTPQAPGPWGLRSAD